MKCAKKQRVNIADGCGSFKPDATTGCCDCYYLDRSRDRYYCRERDTQYHSEQEYCTDFEEKWG